MRRRGALAAAAIAVVLVTAGCGTADPGITAAASTALQQEVRQVARLAATHQYAAAQRSLTALQADLRASVASGAVSESRAARIRTAVGLVAADLRAGTPVRTAPPTATPTPTPTPTQTPTRATTRSPTVTKASQAPTPTQTWTKWSKGKWKRGKGGRGKGD